MSFVIDEADALANGNANNATSKLSSVYRAFAVLSGT
jgi:hypothetical protein